MEQLVNIGNLIEAVKSFGPFGALLLLWWLDARRFDSMLSEHRQYMNELRTMYTNNVELVKNYQSVAGDLKDIVILNTQAMTHLTHDVRENQYCPQVRIEKQRVQVAKG